MNCNDFHDHLFDYLDGKLPAVIQNTMKAHASECNSCALLVDKFMQIRQSMAEEKMLEPDPHLTSRIIQRLVANQPHHLFMNSPAIRPVLVVAGLFLAILIGFALGNAGATRKSIASNENQQIEMLRSDLHVQDFADENIIIIINK